MDLNNLLSTTINSTSALVAIIGGFLVSRVISLSSEQNSIKRRLREINNEISAKEKMLDNIINWLFEDDLNDFIKANCKKILFEDKTLDKLLKKMIIPR